MHLLILLIDLWHYLPYALYYVPSSVIWKYLEVFFSCTEWNFWHCGLIFPHSCSFLGFRTFFALSPSLDLWPRQQQPAVRQHRPGLFDMKTNTRVHRDTCWEPYISLDAELQGLCVTKCLFIFSHIFLYRGSNPGKISPFGPGGLINQYVH